MGAVKSSVSVQFKVIHHSPAIANPASCVAIRFCCDVVKTHVMMLSKNSETCHDVVCICKYVPTCTNDIQ